MKIQAIIKIIDETRSGISQSTGNGWKSKDCVLEVIEEDGGKSTVACRTFHAGVIEQLEKSMVGDIVLVDIRFFSKARSYIRRDGTQVVDRSTEASVVSLETL